MRRFLFIAYVTVFLLPTYAQSDVAQIITPENIHNLAIVARVSPETFSIEEGTITHYTFHPITGNLVVAMQNSSTPYRTAMIGIYDLVTNEVVTLLEDETFHSSSARATQLVFSPDASLLISVDENRGFIVWDLVNNNIVFAGDSVGSPIITSDNHHLVIFTGTVAHIWDIELQQEVDRRQFNSCGRMRFEDSNLTCSLYTNGHLRIKVYELPSFELLEEQTIDVALENSSYLVESPDGQRFTRLWDHTYQIINTETYEIIDSIETEFSLSGYFTNNSVNIITYWEEGEIVFRNPLTDTELYRFTRAHYSRQDRFGQNDTYFVLFNYATPVTFYGIADCYLTTGRTINLRTGAGTEFDNPEIMEPGERLAVDGQSQDGIYTWWHLSIGYWVRDDVVTESGHCQFIN